METIYNIMPQGWGHEKLKVTQTKQPDLSTFTQDEAGNLTPPEGWTPEVEEAEVDTVVIVDRGGQSVFKFIIGDGLASFLAAYVEHLDTDGRQLLRNTLESSSGIIRAEIIPPKMSLIRGGKR